MRRLTIFTFQIMMFVTLSLFLNAVSVRAESSLEDELKRMRVEFESMQERLGKLEEKVTQQQDEIAAYQSSKESKQGSGDRTIAGRWNPEIGVVADLVTTLDSAKTDGEGADRLSVREVELVLGSAIDPFSRLDATIAFSDEEDPSLEEAYVTHFGLPADVIARFGKFKPKVGKAIPVHRDSLETVDEPLVIQKYFGAEGYNKSGIDFSKNLNLTGPITQQVSFGILEGGNGEEGTAFGETKRRPTLYSHLKNYLDVTENTGLELGFSHMVGSRDEDSQFEVQVLGADATLTHQLSANQVLKLQGEVFNLNRKETFQDVEEDDGFGNLITVRHDGDGNLWGYYALADLRFHPQWSTGFRYDMVQPVDLDRNENPQKEDRGLTSYLTFHQSEFARWRLQGTHVAQTTGKDDNKIMLQGTFAIGEHKHKIQ